MGSGRRSDSALLACVAGFQWDSTLLLAGQLRVIWSKPDKLLVSVSSLRSCEAGRLHA
jgi:hypothetical protein